MGQARTLLQRACPGMLTTPLSHGVSLLCHAQHQHAITITLVQVLVLGQCHCPDLIGYTAHRYIASAATYINGAVQDHVDWAQSSIPESVCSWCRPLQLPQVCMIGPEVTSEVAVQGPSDVWRAGVWGEGQEVVRKP